MIDEESVEAQFHQIKSLIQSFNKKPVFTNGNYVYELDEVLFELQSLKDSVLRKSAPSWHSRREMPDDRSKLEPYINENTHCYRLLCLVSTPGHFFKTRFETFNFVPYLRPISEWMLFYLENGIIKWTYFNDIAPEYK